MKLHEQWQEICNQNRTPDEQKIFWEAYFETEKEAYKIVLSEKNNIVEGTVAELADKFDMTKTQVIGFIDGINTSLEEDVELDSLEADTKVTLNIIWEKLYENMLDAKADWLYSLTEWDPIFTAEQRTVFKRNFNKSRMAVSEKVGRNDPCSCGSGLKYKKCCGK